MLVEFVVGSLFCSERFFSRYSSFPIFSKPNTSKFQFDPECADVWYLTLRPRGIGQPLTLPNLNKFLFSLGSFMPRRMWQNIKATNKLIKSYNFHSSYQEPVSICLFTKSYFLQLLLPLLSYKTWIQFPYHVYLKCQVRCYLIQDAVFINQDAVSETTAFEQSYFWGRLNTNNGCQQVYRPKHRGVFRRLSCPFAALWIILSREFGWRPCRITWKTSWRISTHYTGDV